jgi:hypothetical protein
MSTNDFKSIRIPCDDCGGGPRNHDILREFTTVWEEEELGENGKSTYQICRCRGCDAVRFRRETWSTYEYDPQTNEPEVSEWVYPEAATSERESIDVDLFPEAVSRIYLETVRAFNAGSAILTGGGLRAIVEAICIDQQVAGSNLQQKIDDLVKKGLLAKPQADLLHEERYIGNSALHEILPPAKRDLEDGLTIVEGLLNTIYTLPNRAKRLRQRRTKSDANQS